MNEWVPARCRQWLTNGDKDVYTISPTFLFNSSIHLHIYLAKLAAREKHYLWKLFLKLWGCKMFFEPLMVFKQEKYTPCAAEQNQHVTASQERTDMSWCEGLSWEGWLAMMVTVCCPSPALQLPMLHRCLSLSDSNGCAPINTPGTEVKPAVAPQTQGETHLFFLMGEI